MGEQGIDPLLVVGVDHQTGPLIQQEQVLILVHDVKLGLEHGEKRVLPAGRLKKLVVDVELDHISGLQPLIPLGGPPVALDPFQAQILLGQRRGKKRERLRQPPVHTLAGVVFRYGKLLHGPRSYRPPPASASALSKWSLTCLVNSRAAL